MKSSEVEQITSLDQPTYNHTLHHIDKMTKAYVCGGKTTDGVLIKVCLVFDILNQKFKVFGQLNTARHSAGVVKCNKYLWVFGGYNKGVLDSIERVSVDAGGAFE